MKILTYDNIKLNNTAVALGKFQGLHQGHMLLIHEICKKSKENNLASVVFTIDMGEDKVINLPEERTNILENAGVDIEVYCKFTPEFGAMSPEEFVKEILVKKLGAKYVVVGTDFRFGYKRAGDVELLKDFGNIYGFKVIAFDKLKVADTVISSSYIRSLIESGEVKLLSDYMGRPYSITGTVAYGKQLGRTIGFPTANLIPNLSKLLPAFGAYSTEVFIDGKLYKGITNVGDNPTIEGDNHITVETHLLDYYGDLYDKEITVLFKDFIRSEKKFNNVEELKAQLSADKSYVLHQ